MAQLQDTTLNISDSSQEVKGCCRCLREPDRKIGMTSKQQRSTTATQRCVQADWAKTYCDNSLPSSADRSSEARSWWISLDLGCSEGRVNDQAQS